MKTTKDYLLLYLKGIAMGSADAVPGVSGGTIAFISGIYEELINSLKSFNLQALRLLLGLKIKAFWQYINASFLLVLFLGIGTAIVSLSRILLYLLDHHPILLWAFFFGLIIASALVVGRKITAWSTGVGLSLVAGVIFGYLITVATRTETPENLGFVFLSGAIAICAMILPGISGSFILILLSKYKFIFGTLKDLSLSSILSFDQNFRVLLAFGLGCVVGILSFSHAINWMLKRYHDLTIAFLTGIMLGSLNKVWPWKITLETYEDRHGEIQPLLQKSVLPWAYTQETGEPSFWIWAGLLAIFGFLLVYLLEKLSRPTSSSGQH